MELLVRAIDWDPKELWDQIPFRIELLRELPGSDRTDYWLGRLPKSLCWLDGGSSFEIGYVVVSARHSGVQISPRAKNLALGLAYVIDPSQISDPELHFEKVRYVAIATADEIGDAP
ncbi:hypothetical protein [Kaistia algarum]|uniref:hypothetical protein n=1 Tax=Kaistia algarum TaxID=2083279 RepID=UPI001402C9B2|nr:hypothetical protein [Kaistia algarum]MCX5516127.1 hypothetical protein [Kaistia algarum]